ncbi:MAG: arginase [Gemmatimonas sp.]
MRLRVIELDGGSASAAVAAESGLEARVVDARDLGSRLRLWASPSAMTEFAGRLATTRLPKGSGPTLTLVGSGDYHHLTAVLLDEIDEPFTLLHFDNHPDWVRFAPRFHCGAWINRALALKTVARVVTIGPCSDDLAWPEFKGGNVAALASGRLEVFPWRREPTTVLRRLGKGACYRQDGRRLRWRNVADDWPVFLEELHARIPTAAVWISVDKDVLRPSDAGTNWDQGQMPLGALLDGIQRLTRGKRVLGADVCGNYSPRRFGTSLAKRVEARIEGAPEPADSALRRNAEVDRALIGTFKEALS